MIASKKRQRSTGNATLALCLEWISCFQQKDVRKKDFLYIQIIGGKPGITLVGIIGNGETKQLAGSILLPEGDCRLELWEKDTISTNDKIGAIELMQYRQKVPQEVTIRNDATCYKLGFKLVSTR